MSIDSKHEKIVDKNNILHNTPDNFKVEWQ